VSRLGFWLRLSRPARYCDHGGVVGAALSLQDHTLAGQRRMGIGGALGNGAAGSSQHVRPNIEFLIFQSAFFQIVYGSNEKKSFAMKIRILVQWRELMYLVLQLIIDDKHASVCIPLDRIAVNILCIY
jgi:hypothetical protein